MSTPDLAESISSKGITSVDGVALPAASPFLAPRLFDYLTDTYTQQSQITALSYSSISTSSRVEDPLAYPSVPKTKLRSGYFLLRNSATRVLQFAVCTGIAG